MAGINFATAADWISTGEVSSMLACMKNREINVEEVDENGQTLLMLACQKGIKIIVDQLLELSSDVNAIDLDNWTPLLNACKGGYQDIVVKLVARGAKVDHKDLAGWTGLMWCCYKGHESLAQFLLDHGANPNVADQYNISCLAWAAGRGFGPIVTDLLAHGAKANVGDKYGTTPLVWACRKGHKEIVRSLLAAGANVDTAGMHSWTPLIVATRGNFSDVVTMLLEHRPNVNSADRESCTALAIACKEGYAEIATALITAGAYINMQDRNGDTNLVHAAKAGHVAIVEALLRKYADVDSQGEDGKTALYWACEKNHVEVCRLILRYEANVDLATKDGDTPLMKATRNRNLEIVQLLIDKKAKVSSVDKQGDTALHIAMRARSKAIVEVLLRNPRHSQLLYRLNHAGETPYNIDTTYQKSILSQIFGARRLNTNEDTENMLGYDLYSSALADILSEPSLSMPICTGLYAKWGSGKSFLLNKLEGELSNFTFQPPEKTQSGKWAVLLVLGVLLGLVAGLASWQWQVGLGMGGATLAAGVIALCLVQCGVKRYDWSWAYSLSVAVAHHLSRMRRFLRVMFYRPPTSAEDLPVRFVFIKQTKVNSSTESEHSPVSQIVIQLHQALEKEFGFFTTHFAKVLKPRPTGSRKAVSRKVCCIPVWILAMIGIGSAGTCLALGPVYARGAAYVGSVLLGAGCVLAALTVACSHTLLRLASSLVISHHRRIFHAASCHSHLLKKEIDAITATVQSLDGFCGQQTRLVVIVDGLDSCEANKVLKVLDSVNLLFSTPNSPFVLILALDPHIIIKAVEAHVSSVGGYDYLRNLVHLPFYLQNSGLRRAAMAQQVAAALRKSAPAIHEDALLRKSSNSSNISELIRSGTKSRLAQVRLRPSDSMNSSINNLATASGAPRNTVFGPHDLTRVLLTDDYFSDVNPRSMRRLLNIIYITGRLLKSFNIEFNWFHLASWVNITERWPYRLSWVLLYFEMHESEFEDTVPLRHIYDRVKPYFPDCKELSLLDHDDRKLEVVLSVHSTSLLVADLKIFTPFTINLDPYIRKSIQEDNQHIMELLRPGATAKAGIKTSASKWSIRALPAPKSEPSVAECPPLPPEPVASPPAPSAPYRRLLPHLSGVRLSHLTTEEVSHYLATRVERLDRTRLPTYQAAITQHNLNGLVLSSCDLGELKAVLGMAFGDWEIFKLHLQALRHQESTQPTTPPSAELRIVPPTPSNILEKQVTLEESMLFGALETLNEETQEVAAAEELSFSSDPAELNVLYLRSPRDSPLPPKGVGGGSLSGSVVELSSVRCSQPIDIPLRDGFSPSMASSLSLSSSRCHDCPGGDCAAAASSKSPPEDYPSDDEHTPLVSPIHHVSTPRSPPRVLERQLSIHLPLMDPANDRMYGDSSFPLAPNETIL